MIAVSQRRGVRRPMEAEAIVRVLSGAVGWRVEAALWGEPLLFLSGAAAERSADDVAARLARLGRWVRVEVYDRRGRLAQVRRHAPPFPIRRGQDESLILS